MQKKVLTEQALYYGDVKMHKDWDIDRDKLSDDILQSVIQNKDFLFSRTWDMLNTYISEHIVFKFYIPTSSFTSIVFKVYPHKTIFNSDTI